MKRILFVGTSAKHMDDMKRIVYNVYAEKRIDSAYSAEQARGILQNNSFDFVIVDISSVNSWEYQITHTIYKQTSAFVLILVPQKFSTPVQNGHFRGMAVEKPISRVTFAPGTAFDRLGTFSAKREGRTATKVIGYLHCQSSEAFADEEKTDERIGSLFVYQKSGNESASSQKSHCAKYSESLSDMTKPPRRAVLFHITAYTCRTGNIPVKSNPNVFR